MNTQTIITFPSRTTHFFGRWCAPFATRTMQCTAFTARRSSPLRHSSSCCRCSLDFPAAVLVDARRITWGRRCPPRYLAAVLVDVLPVLEHTICLCRDVQALASAECVPGMVFSGKWLKQQLLPRWLLLSLIIVRKRVSALVPLLIASRRLKNEPKPCRDKKLRGTNRGGIGRRGRAYYATPDLRYDYCGEPE